MNSLPFKHINDYLHYGYIPDFGHREKILEFFGGRIQTESFPLPQEEKEEYYLDKGVELLNNIFDHLLEKSANNEHLVPLSGGLDSRLILAALLERVPAKKIRTVTFGTPGSMDFDIPRKIVKGTGINAEFIDCTKIDFNLDNLTQSAMKGGRWTSTPDIYINRLALKSDKNITRWSGFLGGEVAGHYANLGYEGETEYHKFALYQKRSKSINLTHQDYSPAESLYRPVGRFLNLTEFEMIYLFNRTAAGAIPILYPTNTDILTPLAHPKWVWFMSSLPGPYRDHGYLYNKILLKMFPGWMSKPCKNNAGLGLGDENVFRKVANHAKLKLKYEVTKKLHDVYFPPVGINYIYYKAGIKQLPSLRRAIEETCLSLEERQVVPWISPKEIFEDHLSNKRDHSEALLLLLGLEVNLRIEEFSPEYKIV